MQVDELAVPGAWAFTPRQFADPRGVFLEWFKADVLRETVGHDLALRQANHSVSARGTLRGVHFADVPPGQAKYVYCPRGAVLDVVVDLRDGSPTFGVSDAVRLDDTDRRGVYLSEGLGHAFLALTDDASVTYLCSEPYAPGREHGVSPLDAELDLPWPDDVAPLLSDKDAAA
ncbi:MAG: dTDP-4-dehydrorhamnose 3,5-epimerase, partial [Actinomycetota bacterium]|nr:dTDP-4-dehydrorhamnose 3,5-epimerase [Actinomycetota bacterium]